MDIDTDRIDDAVLALLWLGFTTVRARGSLSIGTRWTGCTRRG